MAAKIFFFIVYSFVVGFLTKANFLFLSFILYLIIFRKPKNWYFLAVICAFLGFLYAKSILAQTPQPPFTVINYPQKFENFQKVTLKDSKGNIYFAFLNLHNKVEPGTIIHLNNLNRDKRTFFFPKIEIVGQKETLLRKIGSFREFLENNIKKSLPFPEENLLRGLIFGSEITDEKLKNNFQKSNLSHLTAVSGYNLTVITFLIFGSLSYLKFITPQLNLIISFFVIFFFVFLMGFQGSVLRASLIGFLLLIVKYLGMPPIKINLLFLVLFIFILWRPELVLFDISLHLSLLAFWGILYLKDIFPNKLPSFIREILGAQLSVVFYLASFAGQFNPLGLLANVLVIPFIPILMIYGLISSLLPYLSLLAFPLLNILIKIAEIFSLFNINLFLPQWLIIVIYFTLGLYFLIKRRDVEVDLNFLSR